MNHPEVENPLLAKARQAIEAAFSPKGKFPTKDELHEATAGIMHENPDLDIDILMLAYDEWQAEQRANFKLSLKYGQVETEMYENIGSFAHTHGAIPADKLYELFTTFMESYVSRLMLVPGVPQRLLVMLFDHGVSLLLQELPQGSPFENSPEYKRLQSQEVQRQLMIEWGVYFEEEL